MGSPSPSTAGHYGLYFGTWRKQRFGLLGFNASATARVISRFGLVYWGLTPQQQPGSYQGSEMMMMKSVFWWRKPEYLEETTDLRQVTDETFHTYGLCPVLGLNLGRSGVKRSEVSSLSYHGPPKKTKKYRQSICWSKCQIC